MKIVQLVLAVFTPLTGIKYWYLLEGVNMNIEVLGVKLPAVNITGLAKPAFMPACVRHVLVCPTWV